jgi:hypothetical protein
VRLASTALADSGKETKNYRLNCTRLAGCCK